MTPLHVTVLGWCRQQKICSRRHWFTTFFTTGCLVVNHLLVTIVRPPHHHYHHHHTSTALPSTPYSLGICVKLAGMITDHTTDHMTCYTRGCIYPETSRCHHLLPLWVDMCFLSNKFARVHILDVQCTLCIYICHIHVRRTLT